MLLEQDLFSTDAHLKTKEFGGIQKFSLLKDGICQDQFITPDAIAFNKGFTRLENIKHGLKLTCNKTPCAVFLEIITQ